MLDIQLIRDNPNLIKEKSVQKGYEVDVDQLLGFDKKRLELLRQVEHLRERRNKLNAKAKGQKPSKQQVEQGRSLKQKLGEAEHQLAAIEKEFRELLKAVPNMPLEDVPIGTSEDDNVISHEWGNKPKFTFQPKTHWEIGRERGWIDKERAAKTAGSRFAYLKGDLVLLEFGLWQFALSVLTDENILKKIIKNSKLKVSSKPFLPVLPPAVANTKAYEATARLDKEAQTYKLEDDDLWLNASAEHTLAPMHMNEILNIDDLPLRYVGYTTAFRREAGTYGKDLEGIMRLHQFNKMEMESFSTSETGINEHLFMIAIQEYLMQQLELPYRLLNKCTADIGGPNARGVDIDVWLPGQDNYCETHTADYITDYQARRLKTRTRRSDGSIELVHTNDATVFSERPLIGIIENNQTADLKVRVPKVLRPFVGNKQYI